MTNLTQDVQRFASDTAAEAAITSGNYQGATIEFLWKLFGQDDPRCVTVLGIQPTPGPDFWYTYAILGAGEQLTFADRIKVVEDLRELQVLAPGGKVVVAKWVTAF